MMTLAKALYDNTAECPDELAFRKGDIVMVMEQNVPGTSGWWMCSLYGRQGLAPANRLRLLPQSGCPSGTTSPVQERQPSDQPQSAVSLQNIYQIPSAHRPPSGTELVYRVPATPMLASRSANPSGRNPKEPEGLQIFSMAACPRGELYDVPSPVRRGSLFPIYAVPPTSPQDPNYDIPIPSVTEKAISGYNTLPIPAKPEWIYDVPVIPDKQSPPQMSVPPRSLCRQLYDTIPTRVHLVQRAPSSPSLYDIPTTSSFGSPALPPRVPICNKPLRQGNTEESVYDIPNDDPPNDYIPLECRVQPFELTRVPLHRMRNCPSLCKGSPKSLVLEELDQSRTLHLSEANSQRISTASSSSSSSCDSLALNSSSPEPLRDVTLQQEEVCRRLLDLQEGVCKVVPRLMEFVSSGWRSRHHLEKHIDEIREAARGITASLTCFLNFALDIKGNARRLTDANLQTRLYKQLCVVEDSGVILQQIVSALNVAGWPLDLLSQEARQAQTPDQLERFVMVARTIPEDIKRLVSMINANGKLLFRPPQKDPEPVNSLHSTTQESRESRAQEVDVVEDDYVELQTKTDFEKQQKEVQNEQKENVPLTSNNAQSEEKHHSSESSGGTDEHQPAFLSEHCRLYFGALQKAIGGFVGSLRDGQPPEKFISQSKLVIMVGQRLVDTLCREAHRGGSTQSILIKSSHLCALLKQLAVATKKAAVHFPDRQAVHEAHEFAKELAQRVQHFRLSLDL